MAVKCGDIIRFMEEFAPPRLAEDWDNVGLMVGSREDEVKKVMVCLDVTPKVIEAASEENVDLIISHHPLIFKGLKRINREDFKGKIVMDLIQKGINVYSAHTNLDVTDGGINQYLSQVLGLKNIKNLKEYKIERLLKLVVFVPKESLDTVRDAMSKAGAGWIGNYSDCSFTTEGIGTFRPQEGTNPYIGTQGNLEKLEEYRVETVASERIIDRVVSAMISAHPYEEVAYDIYPLEIPGKEYGMGCVGEMGSAMQLDSFAEVVKNKLNAGNVRVIGNLDREIKKAAVFCGSFDNDIMGLAKSKADVLVTGDVKYHDALDMLQMGMCVIDAGHFSTERIIVPRLVEILKKKFSGVEVMSNNVEEDPFKYI
ncbi:Nif3-like dinuclear metal center hexameric protein [Acetivibrio cellulolyticus]|uniref:Nif3-like dinuclear metal center hexameric protein n=1 Tax=Acetivibrio cellulolyticus TaxID=35830 RepID=UPI0001E2E6CD|nr:Nif3-like dinuclear metal center hexameric protein [Acetivibrio cellulolyticus]